MAKINIILNNKNYLIDEADLAPAINALKAHLSTAMAGTGATINLGGIEYNVDSAKLTTAKNNFVAHLSSIEGEGKKVIIGGVEYNISSDKINDALVDLETILGDLTDIVLMVLDEA